MELLGEAQLSFVLFISLSSLQGFRHWQAVCALLCQCGDALAADPALFVAFIRVRRVVVFYGEPVIVFDDDDGEGMFYFFLLFCCEKMLKYCWKNRLFIGGV